MQRLAPVADQVAARQEFHRPPRCKLLPDENGEDAIDSLGEHTVACRARAFMQSQVVHREHGSDGGPYPLAQVTRDTDDARCQPQMATLSAVWLLWQGFTRLFRLVLARFGIQRYLEQGVRKPPLMEPGLRIAINLAAIRRNTHQ